MSLQLFFAVISLVMFTNSKAKMGWFANKPWLVGLAWVVTATIVVLNGYLLVKTFASWLA